MPLNRILFFPLLLAVFLCTALQSYAQENYKYDADRNSQAIEWVFHKVSRHNVLQTPTDEDLIETTEKKYSNFKIKIQNGTLNIIGSTGGLVCSIDYVRLKKTPLNYWMAQSTVNLYETLFAAENIPLQAMIYEVTATTPADDCTEPFGAFIDNAGLLITVIDSGYLLVFQKITSEK